MNRTLGIFRTLLRAALPIIMASGAASSCIEPPLRLPAQEVIVDLPIVITEMEAVWDINVDWDNDWHYGWDDTDTRLFGPLAYPEPTSYEIRRYFLGDTPGVHHTSKDPYTIYGSTFRSTYQFGWYDMLLWSNIDSSEGVQVVTINEDNLDNVTASTTITRSIMMKGTDARANALYNQPEPFYSAYPQGIKITHFKEDYDYFDEEDGVWVKKIKADLTPLVYIYAVQIILINNDGRIRDVSGDCAVSAFANSTSVNTGHTSNEPCMIYFNSRMKKGLDFNGVRADIIGAKFTTYGLCDMDGYTPGTKAEYTGSRPELPNYLLFELQMSSGSIISFSEEITQQCQAQSHGGVITIIVDCNKVKDPGGKGESIFNPTVDDYDELEFEIPM